MKMTIAAVSLGLFGAAAAADPDADWQTRQLLSPSSSQLLAESKGRVFIYDSLESNRVETALDQHFDRIENMMFIRVIYPPGSEADESPGDDDC